MSEFGDWPPELLARAIKAMAPIRVCRTCGEPQRRIVTERVPTGQADRAALRLALSTHIRQRRESLGMTQNDVAEWFPSASGQLTGCVSNWENGKVPTAAQWAILKERLRLSDEYDELIHGKREWAESVSRTLAEYIPHGDPTRQNAEDYAQARMGQNPSAQAMPKGRATKLPKDAGWTDCGHDNWRPGAVCDPFGVGATAEVAEALGRVGIEIR